MVRAPPRASGSKSGLVLFKDSSAFDVVVFLSKCQLWRAGAPAPHLHITNLFLDHEVRGALACDTSVHLKSELRQIDSRKQILTFPQQHR